MARNVSLKKAREIKTWCEDVNDHFSSETMTLLEYNYMQEQKIIRNDELYWHVRVHMNKQGT